MDSTRNITFNVLNMQTDHIFTEEIGDGLPDRMISMVTLAHANASKIPYDEWPTRTIPVSGTIIGDSVADLDARLDAFKAGLLGTDKNLDVSYGSGTRRYIATADLKSDSIQRPGGLLYATFEFNFICTRPFGQDQTPTVLCDYRQRQLLTANFQFNSTTFTGWSVYNGATTARDLTNPYESTGSVKITSTGTGANAYQGMYTNPGYAVTVGNIYTYSVYVRGAAGTIAHIQLSDSGGQTNATATMDGTWQRISVTRTAAGTTLTATQGVDGANAGVKTINYDAALLELGSSPSTWFDSSQRQGTSFNDSFTFGGTAPWQQPIVTLTVNTGGAAGAGTIQIGNNTNGQAINITRTWAFGDILIVDVYNKNVQVNGVDTDFTGAFPEFPTGPGVLALNTNLSSMYFNYNVTLPPQYL